MVQNSIGLLIASRRETTPNPQTDRMWTQDALAKELERRGFLAARTTLSHYETGRIARLDPKIINAIAEILPVSVTEMVRALGFNLEVPDLSDAEMELVTTYRRE